MARRGSLIGSMKAARDQVEAEIATAAPPYLSTSQMPEPMITTAVHIPKSVHSLLRRAAVEQANRDGGRPSVSAVLTELVERHRAELEGEAKV